MEHSTVAKAVEILLQAAEGDSWNREGLLETPERFAKAWEFFTSGYSQNPADVLKSFADGANGYNEMIVMS